MEKICDSQTFTQALPAASLRVQISAKAGARIAGGRAWTCSRSSGVQKRPATAGHAASAQCALQVNPDFPSRRDRQQRETAAMGKIELQPGVICFRGDARFAMGIGRQRHGLWRQIQAGAEHGPEPGPGGKVTPAMLLKNKPPGAFLFGKRKRAE